MIAEFLLTVARDRVPVDASLANPIGSVTVLQLPLAAVNVKLHFGHGDPGRLLTAGGQTFEPDPQEAREGLFVSNGVGGGTLILDVAFVTYREPQPVIDVSRSRPGPTGAGAWVNQLMRNFGLK